ncbi:hypothetical protein BDV96DRAFT_596844 [Lophiotrema nucula]|uniref:Uncharacterized protein n=1 Tax=Lophiotrema nucula TaxID=690887 RepID=A0A6A5ZJR3_9PLEO|nr:hypothetical protein BDV96DRAFT_596844 [Lophiotrema nucula]
MQPVFKTCLIFGATLSLLWFFFAPNLPALFHVADMETLKSSFTIEISGTPIAKVDNDAEDRSQAKTGPDAAIFTLQDGRLKSGDWYLGRNKTENRSMLPKPVLWFKVNDENEKVVKPVSAEKEGDELKLEFANGANVKVNVQ